MIGTIGNIALIRENPDFAIKNVALIKDIKKIDYLYLYQYLQSNNIAKQFDENMDGGTQKFIALNKVRNLSIMYPTISEQIQIGGFLEKLDNLITLHHRKFSDILVYKLSTKFLFLKFAKNVWEQRKLGDECFELIAGGDIDKTKSVNNGKYPIYANALTNDGIVGYYNDSYRVKSPAVTITGRGEIGYAMARNTDFTPVVRLISLRSKHNNYFLANAINLLNVVSESTGVPQLTIPQVEKFDIYFPKNINEEIKLGRLFNEIDNLITLHHRKYTYIFYSWEQRKAKDLCSITTGKSNTQDQVQDGKYPFYIRSDVPVRSNRYLYDEEAVITIGDGNIGRVFHYVNGKFDLHQRCYKMADFKALTAKYFYYYFSTKFYERAMSMTAKATVDSVRLEMISDMEIKFPKSTTEQTNISELFTNLDNLITLHQHKELKRRNDNNEHLRW